MDNRAELTRGGLIIRLIDIALIILFGFISISDIRIQTQIKLPTPVKDYRASSQYEVVFVKIDSTSAFHLIEKEPVSRAMDLEGLEEQLQKRAEYYRALGKEIVVLVQPDGETPVQLTVDVLDLCRKLNLKRNIAYNYASLQL